LKRAGLKRACITGLFLLSLFIFSSKHSFSSGDYIGVDALVLGQTVDTAPSNKLGGGKIDLKSFRGKKPVVIAFWLNSCNLCLQQLDQLRDYIKKNNRGKGIAVVTDARAENSEFSAYKETLRKHNLTFPVIIDPKLDIAAKLGVNTVPSYILIDREGRIASPQFHYLNKPVRDYSLLKMIDILISGKQIPPIQFEPYTQDTKLKRMIGTSAAQFELNSVDNKVFNLKDYLSKTNVVLVFWHPYSANCKSVISVLNRFYSQENRQKYNFVILSASSIYGASQTDEIIKTSRSLQSSFPYLIDSDSKVGKQYNVQKIPTIFVIDRNGRIRDVFDDFTVSSVERRIKAVFDSMLMY